MKLYLLLIFTSFTCNIFAQTQNRFVFSRISKGSGLASDVVMSAAQDSEGYMWFATGNGLQRYDGNRFLTIRHIPGDSLSLPEGFPAILFFDSKKRLWIVMSGNVIGIFDVHSFKFRQVKITLPSDVRNNDFSRFREEPDGTIHLLVTAYGIITYSEKNNEFSPAYNPVQFEDGKIAQELCYAGSGNYWVSVNKELDLYNTATKKIVPKQQSVIATDMTRYLKEEIAYGPSGTVYDSLGNFWTLTWSSKLGAPEIYQYSNTDKKWYTYNSSLSTSTKGYFVVGDMLQQRDGTTWVYGGNIFARLNKKTNKFEDIRNESLLNHGIMVETVFDLFEDKDENLWVCTTSGLYFFNPGKQFFINLSNTRNDDRKYTNSSDAVIQTRDGNIYTTAWGAGIFAYDSLFNVIPNPIIPEARRNDGISVWDMQERRNGEIWMAMQGGSIRVFNEDTKKSIEYHHPVFENHTVRQLAEDSLGNMWMGTQSGLVIKCDKANWRDTAHAYKVVQRVKGHVVKMAVDSYGYVWVCTDRFGVFKLNPSDGKIVDHYSDNSPDERRLKVAGASDILQYNDSIMLLASGAVERINLKTGIIKHGDFKRGDAVGYAVSFVKDRDGVVWVGTFDGLYRYETGKKFISYYDGDDGITDTRFQPNATAVLKDGSLVLGTTTGLLLIDPGKYKTPATATAPNISEFRVFDKNLSVDSLLQLGKISLPYSDNSLTINLSTVNYNHEFAIKYKLEGLDKNWQFSPDNSVKYSYLAPGVYTLKIQSFTVSGIESPEKSFIIEIKPPFWNSWGFYGILILAFIGILYLIDKERMKRLRSTQQIRSEIGLNLAGEVTAALNNINLMSEMANRKADNDIERSKELIGQITEKSNNMIIALDDMLWSIDPVNDHMEKILQRMAEFSEAMQKNFDVKITMQTDERLHFIELNMRLRYGLYSIFKEGLRSIIQCSGGMQTLVNIDMYKNKIMLKMQDTTAHYTESIQSSNAAEEMKKHAAYMNAELDLQQDKNGIYIFLMFPLK